MSEPIFCKVFMRKGRFRKVPVSLDEIKREGLTLFPQIQTLKECLERENQNPAVFTAAYIQLFLSLRHPKTWKGSLLATPLGNSLIPALEVFESRALKSVPLAVNRALVHWYENPDLLVLRHDVPPPSEILDLQCEGRRCISVVCDLESLCHLVHGERDPLGFVLHDLIHADKFFRNPERSRGQREFYLRIRESYRKGIFDHLLEDPVFKKEFEYLISDMNSHPVHLQMTLDAIVRHALARNQNRNRRGSENPGRHTTQRAQDLATTVSSHNG